MNLNNNLSILGNEKRLQELKEVAKPLVDFFYKYGCPHSYVVVTQTSAELLSGECGTTFEPRD